MRNLLMAIAIGTAAPVAAQGGAPTKADIAPLLTLGRASVTIHFIEIGAPHRANAFEASHLEADLGEPIYPIHASYTMQNGIFIRDTDSHWYAYRSRVKQGAWDVGNWTQPGDKFNVERP